LNTRNNNLEETDKCIRCFKFKVITETKTKTLKKHNKAIKTEIIDILLNGRNSKEYKKNKQIKKT
jgi:hypothetical protein